MPIVIAEPTEVSPEWLTVILRRSYAGWNGHVSTVGVVWTKRLQVSSIAQLKVEYLGGPQAGLPDYLFLKLSIPAARGQVWNNASEVEFYRSVAAAMEEGPLVRCYDAEFSAEPNRSHILLEDLSSSHFQTTEAEHPPPLYSEAAIDCLARFHAYWWDHPDLGTEVGTVFDQSWLENFVMGLETSVPEFLENSGAKITPELRIAYERMLKSSRRIWGRLTNISGLTVSHGDMHWWNFLYPKDLSADRVRIFDWQLWHIDLGPRDLAFLIALGGFAERKPKLEMGLLRLYRESLLRYGVQDYSWKQFWDDYRWSAIRNLNIPVIFRSHGKHPATWGSALERAFQSYNELKCEELLR